MKSQRRVATRQKRDPGQDREATRPLLKRVPAPELPELASYVCEPEWLVHTDRAFCRYAVRAGTDRDRQCRRTPVTILDGFPFCAVHTQILRETVPVRSMSAYRRQGRDIDAAWVARAQAAEREGRFLGPNESMRVLREMTGPAKRQKKGKHPEPTGCRHPSTSVVSRADGTNFCRDCAAEKLGKGIDDRPEVLALLQRLKERLPELERLLSEVNGEWVYEDGVYRFYHESWKVYKRMQYATMRMGDTLRALAPAGCSLNKWFEQIMSEGTGKQWTKEHNERWLQETRPIVEAFFHARYFLEMGCKYGRELEFPPRILRSGWAALLYLFNLR